MSPRRRHAAGSGDGRPDGGRRTNGQASDRLDEMTQSNLQTDGRSRTNGLTVEPLDRRTDGP